MSRILDSTFASGLQASTVYPIRLAQIQFKSEMVACWSGAGTLSVDGVDYKGVGSLGKITEIAEGVGTSASGVTLELSGIDPTLFAECMTDIQLGATARIFRALLSSAGTLIGSPYQCFRGQVDKPEIMVSGEAMTIRLALESRIVNLQRASSRRYTSADQRLEFPTDSAFGWVEQLNDLALAWGD